MDVEESVLLRTRAILYLILALLLVILGTVAWSAIKEPAPVTLGCGTKTGVESSDSLYQAGKQLFVANCASCHNKNMKDDLTGPALGGLEERWAAYPGKDLYQWIRGSQEMIKRKHPRAVQLWQKWNPTIMNDFRGLTDAEIAALLHYIRQQAIE